ncbi:LolA family protein [Polymorphobacter multimanifer]|uniref:Outer membrane lipoprotein-sorting protein n=1 Tax=Polymorphobacter multimanifer TaxID=1070431 RepID=A0A841L028_9SPHN|nr:outer membrane lipoprotein carrier protein LolA [Polymorphobacter multimanifer]MBB6226179.1 outer membrane lipoprotein-sorting protein [Polymorphobacter multimanifer]
MKHALAPFAAALALASAAPVAAAPATLADVSRSLAATTSMTASFTQTGADGRSLTGKMALARPGKVRFEYDTAKILLVGDGRLLSFVDYSVRQVSQWPVKSTPLGILLSAEPDLSGVATIIGGSDEMVIVEARDPKRPEFGTLAIRFTREAGAPGGLALSGWTARDAQGGSSEIRLTEVRYNADLKKADWSFRDPRRTPSRAG